MMKNILLLVAVSALASMCAGVGCASSFNVRHANAAYTLILANENEQVFTVQLKNNTNHELISHGLFLMPSADSAGLSLSVIDEGGHEHHLCAMVDQASPGEGRIPAHGVLVKNFYLSWFKAIYCLKSGRYTVRAIFAVPRKSEIPKIVAVSAPISVTIEPD